MIIPNDDDDDDPNRPPWRWQMGSLLSSTEHFPPAAELGRLTQVETLGVWFVDSFLLHDEIMFLPKYDYVVIVSNIDTMALMIIITKMADEGSLCKWGEVSVLWKFCGTVLWEFSQGNQRVSVLPSSTVAGDSLLSPTWDTMVTDHWSGVQVSGNGFDLDVYICHMVQKAISRGEEATVSVWMSCSHFVPGQRVLLMSLSGRRRTGGESARSPFWFRLVTMLHLSSSSQFLQT